MNILILGGTRFIGLELANTVAKNGHSVTVASRRNSQKLNQNIKQIKGERDNFLKNLQELFFDVVFDFIAYDYIDVMQVYKYINFKNYILISTTWLPLHLNLEHGASLLPNKKHSFKKSVLQITANYLQGKSLAEQAVNEMKLSKKKATILRLPVITGTHDHTKRLHFYRTRFNDGGGIIILDDYHHKIQITNNTDLARVITKWVETYDTNSRIVWEALPPESIIWKEFLEDLALNDNNKGDFYIFKSKQVYQKFNEYLEKDPFWQERTIILSNANIFKKTGIMPTHHKNWMRNLEPIDMSSLDRMLRKKEITFIKTFKYKN